MLQHMIKAQVLQLVLCRVNLLVRIFEVTLNDKGTRISSFTGTGVIGAGVTALGQDVGDIAISSDDFLNEFGEARVDEISNDADALGFAGVEGVLHITSHVLLEHGFDVATFLLVGLEDCL